MRTKTDIVYNDKGQLLDIYMPDGNFDSVFLFFHGGGLEGGSKADHAGFSGYLLERNIAVISAEYRMYPDAKYPDFIEDAADAVTWVLSHIGEYGNCKRVFVGGSSAGGYLSMMLCFDQSYLSKRGIKPCDISGYIHNAGQPTKHFNVLRESGTDTRRLIVDESAPLYHVGTGSKDLPPMLFLVSDNDIENRYEQTMLMLSTLKHFEYDQNKIKHKVLHGSHCEQDNAVDENGDSVLGKLVYEFISHI